MPSLTHQALVAMFRARPALAAELLADPLHVPVPSHARATASEASLDQLVPVEFRADLVIDLEDARGAPVASIILEVQLGR